MELRAQMLGEVSREQVAGRRSLTGRVRTQFMWRRLAVRTGGSSGKGCGHMASPLSKNSNDVSVPPTVMVFVHVSKSRVGTYSESARQRYSCDWWAVEQGRWTRARRERACGLWPFAAVLGVHNTGLTFGKVVFAELVQD